MVKARQTLRFLRAAAAALPLAGIASCDRAERPPPETAPPPRTEAPPSRIPHSAAPSAPPRPEAGTCGAAGADPDSTANAQTLRALAWRPFGRPELGWETYAPLIAREIGTACPPDSPGFARALTAWREAHGLQAHGRMDEAAFLAMKARWQEKRPFVRLAARGGCPVPPSASNLVPAKPEEGYMGKIVLLRPRALEAYRRMVQAAREEAPEIFQDPSALKIFSAFRSPESDADRCLREGNCDGVRRATCSPHRTGLAMDLYVGAAPGLRPDSSADPNRLHHSKTPEYGWLLANAARFGFVNYPFEPWHWEWTGEAP